MSYPAAPPSLWSVGALRRRLLAPEPIERLVFLRIGIPLALLGFLSGRLIYADYWLTPLGFQVPDLGGHSWQQPLYLPAIPVWAAWTVAIATALSGLLLVLGCFTRAAAAVFAALLAYLALADRLEAFTVSKIGPVLVLMLALGPAGARYSIDAWRARRRGIPLARPTHVAAGPLRFVQLFLVAMYLGSGIAKLRGDWLGGPVLWTHIHDSYQTAVTYFLVRHAPPWLWGAVQKATLLFEAGSPLWFALPWTRPAAFLAGLLMHLLIGLMFGPVVWFALLMSILLLGCYLPERWLVTGFGRLAGARLA